MLLPLMIMMMLTIMLPASWAASMWISSLEQVPGTSPLDPLLTSGSTNFLTPETDSGRIVSISQNKLLYFGLGYVTQQPLNQ